MDTHNTVETDADEAETPDETLGKPSALAEPEPMKTDIIAFVRENIDALRAPRLLQEGDAWHGSDETDERVTDLGWVEDGFLTDTGASIMNHAKAVSGSDYEALFGYVNAVGSPEEFVEEADEADHSAAYDETDSFLDTDGDFM